MAAMLLRLSTLCRAKVFLFAILAAGVITQGAASAATLAGFNVNALPGGANNFGPSPQAATTTDSGVTVVGLTRGTGVGTGGTGAGRAWGGTTWTSTSAAAAITANQFVTFSLTANAGKTMSLSSISKFDYRRSGSGATSGVLQYRVGAGSFVDITTLDYSSTSSSGASLSPVSLSGISALQNVAAGTTVTFRIANWGATAAGGTWYVYDVANSAASDLEVQGTVSTSGPTPPALSSSTPADGSTGVAVSSAIALNFNQSVTLGGTWYTLTGSTSGTIAATLSGSGASYTLTPAVAFANNETVQLTVLAPQVTNAGGTPMDANAVVSFSTAPAVGAFTPIHNVQGSGASSPMSGTSVTIKGVVVGDFQGATPALGGFFVQEEDADIDGSAATSEGVFVYQGGSGTAVSVGDVVEVTGTVTEFNGLTEIGTVTLVTKTGTAALPTAAVVTLPAASTTALEAYEGMRVVFNQTLSVSDNHLLGQYGELGLTSGGVLRNPTEEIDPNDASPTGNTSSGTSNVAAVLAALDSNARRWITLDDASTASYPDPTPFLDASNTRRAGDTVTGLTGILSYGFSAYRLYPVGSIPWVSGNPREATPPVVNGRLKVVGFNVENYFTTFGSRGASDATEFARQQAKTLAALTAISGDVVGLVEIQNNGTTALDNLVSALNNAMGANTYARVSEPSAGGGTDEIRVAFIYKPSKVTPSGVSISQVNSTWSRQPLAQLFVENSTGEKFIACVNHLKSKSSSGASGADADQGDGQGAYNDRRKQQANLLVSFLNSVRTTTGENDVVILGDLNAYAQEDPIDILRAAGYLDQSLIHTPGGYSYLFDGASGHLDHALANSSMSAQIVDMDNWHINSPEPLYYNYFMDDKSAAQQAINVGTPYRCSDHDPVIVGISLAPPSVTYSSWSSTISWPSGADTSASGDPDGDGLTNLEELVAGAGPTTRDPGARPSVSISGDTLSLNYRSRTNLDGFVAVPQWSTNLTNWFDIGSPTVQSAYDPTTNNMKASVSISGQGLGQKAFLRLDIRPE